VSIPFDGHEDCDDVALENKTPHTTVKKRTASTPDRHEVGTETPPELFSRGHYLPNRNLHGAPEHSAPAAHKVKNGRQLQNGNTYSRKKQRREIPASLLPASKVRAMCDVRARNRRRLRAENPRERQATNSAIRQVGASPLRRSAVITKTNST